MKQFDFRHVTSDFDVLHSTARSQVAAMVLQPGRSTGGPNNVHPSQDRWLYVVAGSGYATVGGSRVDLHAGLLLLIEAGEPHEVTNSGELPLETFNIYAPPAY